MVEAQLLAVASRCRMLYLVLGERPQVRLLVHLAKHFVSSRFRAIVSQLGVAILKRSWPSRVVQDGCWRQAVLIQSETSKRAAGGGAALKSMKGHAPWNLPSY